MLQKQVHKNYAVDRTGNVLSLLTGRKLSANINSNGYLVVCLCDGGHRKMHRVHRLVAEAYIENKDGKLEVNHKNGNKLDNRVENLEWATRSENIRHAFSIGLYPVTERKRQASRINGRKHLSQSVHNASCV